MKGKTFNKLILITLLMSGFTGIFYGTLQPRVSAFSDVDVLGVEETDVKLELYDLYFADYSNHTELDTNRWTLKLLLNISNPYEDREIIIPRLSIDLFHIDKPLGQIWTNNEFKLEPFRSAESRSSGLMPIYLSLFITGVDSGFSEFINNLLLGEIGTLSFNATIEIGNLPINLQSMIGEIMDLLGMASEGSSEGLDLATIMADLLGGELGSIQVSKWDNAIIANNNTHLEDFRTLSLLENQSIFKDTNQILYFGNKEKFDVFYWENATCGNNATGDGVYKWEYYNGSNWKEVNDLSDQTNGFTNDGNITFTMPTDWSTQSLTSFYPDEYYYLRCNMLIADSGIEKDINSFIRMDVLNSSFFGPPEPEEKPGPEPEPQEPIQYPQTNIDEIPKTTGILQSGLDFDEYLGKAGIDLLSFLGRVLMGNGAEIPTGLPVGLEKAGKTEWIGFSDEDMPSGDGLEVSGFLFTIFRFLQSHNINAGQFMVMCEIQWDDGLDYLASNFQNYTCNDGNNLQTGQNIYSSNLGTDAHENTNQMSQIFMFVLVGGIMLAVPMAMKKRDQSTFLSHSDLANVNDVNHGDLPSNRILQGDIIDDSKSEERRWEIFAAIMGIGLGIGLYYIKQFAFSSFDDSVLYLSVPEVFRGIFSNINDTSDANPYGPLTIMLIAFIDFPSCLGWIIPGFLIGYKRNTQFKNLKRRRTGWEVFWHGTYLIEALFAIFSIGLILGYILQTFGSYSPSLSENMSYWSGGLILILLTFISPYFWLGLLGAMIGGYIGTLIGLRKPGKTEVQFKQIENPKGSKRKIFSRSDKKNSDKDGKWENESISSENDWDNPTEDIGWGETQGDEGWSERNDGWGEEEHLDLNDSSSTIKINTKNAAKVKIDSKVLPISGKICKNCWISYALDTERCEECGSKDLMEAVPCPECGELVPEASRFCNSCGYEMEL